MDQNRRCNVLFQVGIRMIDVMSVGLRLACIGFQHLQLVILVC